ncbi:hypothetical protein, partial [Pseudomonas sp. Sample_9]|uniref:hypothetical protein n=1 Tax=Pseudomonas sp. Sample_9 TaxID=2382158 RepID=UPI0019D54112
VGSIPIVHPIFRKAPDLTVWRLFCFSGFEVRPWSISKRRAGHFIAFKGSDDAELLVVPVLLEWLSGRIGLFLLYIEALMQSPDLSTCIRQWSERHSCSAP